MISHMSMETSHSPAAKATFKIKPPEIQTKQEPLQRIKEHRPEIYQKLIGIQKMLRQPIAEGGPLFFSNASMMDAYAVYEVMGEKWESLVRANDLRSYTEQLQYNPDSPPVLSLELPPHFHENGSLKYAKILLNFDYTNKDGVAAFIQRGFISEASESEGIQRQKRLVHHDALGFPSAMQGEGLAVRMFRSSLTAYDTAGIEEIRLFANVDVGSYAWASYGFGYDEQNMSKRRIEQLIEQAKLNIHVVLTHVGLGEDIELFARISNELDQAQTPQEIVAIGADGPFFTRDEDGGWQLCQQKEPAIQQKKSLFHLGKIALINNEWWAKLELTRNGSQKGENREWFEQTLARRLKHLRQPNV